jgi:hypothetical protein
MSDQPRDWDKELAEIDRAMGRPPAASPPGGPRPADAAAIPAGPTRVAIPAPAGAAPVARRHVAATWLKVLLAIGLGAGLVLWPYGRTCGLWLGLYMSVAALTALAGLWAALSTWRHRRGFAHTLALLAIVWGVAITLREVLPRVGYARDTLAWRCVAPGPVPSRPVTPGGAAPATGAPAPGAPAPGAPAPATPTPATPTQ